MCGSSPTPPPPPPPPAPPPVLEQVAPKSANSGDNQQKKKAKGLSRYNIDKKARQMATGVSSLGGISKKNGTGV